MIAVLAEMVLADGREADYLDTAAAMRRELEHVEGFVSVERFRSLSDPARLLSLSFWRDEACVDRWRRLAVHRAAQAAGRAGIFAGYRIRVAAVLRDYDMASRRDQAPADSREAHGG